MRRVKLYLHWMFMGSLWFIALMLMGWALWEKDGFLDYRALQGQKAIVLEEKAVLNAKNHKLSRQVRRLQEDRQYLEAVAMEQLGMIPRNAQVYLFGDRNE